MSGGILAGAVVGGVVGLILLLVAGVLALRQWMQVGLATHVKSLYYTLHFKYNLLVYYITLRYNPVQYSTVH